MRKKKLDVVFDDSVLINAEKIVRKISEHNNESDKCSVNRSEVIRCAMDIGLRALNEKVDEKIEKKAPVVGLIKVGNMKAMFKI